jgi:hypothetical protein
MVRGDCGFNVDSGSSHTFISGRHTAVIDDEFIKPFYRFNPGADLSWNVYYHNSSSSKMERMLTFGRPMNVRAKPTAHELDVAFAEMYPQMAKQSARIDGIELVPQQEVFATMTSLSSLSAEDSRDIRSGDLIVYLLGIIRFSDATGEYQQEMCNWMEKPTPAVVWQRCGSHQEEIRLK